MSDRGRLAARLGSAATYAGARRRGPTWASAAVVVAVLLLNLLQQPGRVTFDTKLDLQFAPLDFLARSLSLWNPDAAVGGLQNQASGYLLPMGPVFAVGELAHVPAWVWERLWSALVMVAAYEGARRLAAAWPGVSRWGAVLAGLTYLAAPRVLTTVGALSGETLPAAVLPWTVLPLVLYLRGSWRRRPALVLSAASVLLMGGQNAALVVACLVLPGLLLLLGGARETRRVVSDVAVWSGLVLCATCWWLVPLLLLGSYAPPFLDFIESAHNTATSTGWLTSLRGTNHWVAFFPDGGSAGWLGGWELATSWPLLVTTVAVAAVGLAGLAVGRLSFRLPLVVSLLVGLGWLTLGSGGPAGSVLAGWWLDALDSWLAPFRNVHKFDPLVRLPLSLGVGAFVTTVVPALVGRVRPPRRQAAVTGRAAAAIAVLVVAAAQPAVAGHLRSSDGMEDLSPAWRRTVAYLDEQPGPAKVLVLPGSGFAVQTWGRTVDEPIQVLGGPPWLARAQVTVAPAGTLRVLDALERRVAEGRPVPGLADVLRRLGITHVVVRGDLDPDESDAPPFEVVHASLAGQPGLTPAAGLPGVEDGPLEVFTVQPAGDPRVTLQGWDDRLLVRGGPEAVVDLVGSGLLPPARPMVLDEGTGAPTDVLTDSNRRVERSFGRVHDAVSGVMTADDEFRVDRRVHDYVDDEVPSEQTVATYDGLRQVVASSSTGYADNLGPVRPDEHPFAAIDGSVFTSWATDPFGDPEGQWIELRFGDPVDLGTLSLQFDVGAGADVTSVRLVTDAGERVADVGVGGRLAGAALPDGATRRLRVVVADTVAGSRQVRLSDLRLEGRELARALTMPGSATSDTAVRLVAEVPRRPCRPAPSGVVTCRTGGQVETGETGGFARTFQVDEPGTWELRGDVVATHGPALQSLLAPLRPREVSLVASSTFAGDPAVGGSQAYDARPETSWYAAPADRTPSLVLRWQGARTIRSVAATLTPGAPGRLPDELVVDPMQPGAQPQVVALTGPDAGSMEPVRTDRLRFTARFVPTGAGATDTEGAGISELSIAGLDGRRHRVEPGQETGVLCGFGPTVRVAGQEVAMEVRGTVGDVLDGGRLALVPCDGAVELAAGRHRLEVTSAPGFTVSELGLLPADRRTDAASAGGAAVVERWGSVDRSVAVSAPVDSVLVVSESFNRGWEARLDDQPLEPVLVDGWKQGFRVPAGAAGAVALTFAPQRLFVTGLAVGAGLAGVLVAASVVLWRRRAAPYRERLAARPGADPAGTAGTSARATGVARVVALVVLALVSVPLAVGAAAGTWLSRLPGRVARGAVVAGLGALPVAAALTLVLAESPLTPPGAAELLTAYVVGLAAAVALTRPPAADTGEDGG